MNPTGFCWTCYPNVEHDPQGLAYLPRLTAFAVDFAFAVFPAIDFPDFATLFLADFFGVFFLMAFELEIPAGTATADFSLDFVP